MAHLWNIPDTEERSWHTIWPLFYVVLVSSFPSPLDSPFEGWIHELNTIVGELMNIYQANVHSLLINSNVCLPMFMCSLIIQLSLQCLHCVQLHDCIWMTKCYSLLMAPLLLKELMQWHNFYIVILWMDRMGVLWRQISTLLCTVLLI